MPIVVKFVPAVRPLHHSKNLLFTTSMEISILLFYIATVVLIWLNGTCSEVIRAHVLPFQTFGIVPYNYPNLSNRSTTTSPFTIVFREAGSSTSLHVVQRHITLLTSQHLRKAVAASFMNTVILTSVLSAGNHVLFAGTRVLYGLAVTIPTRHAPRIFSRTTRRGVPLAALLATLACSVSEALHRQRCVVGMAPESRGGVQSGLSCGNRLLSCPPDSYLLYFSPPDRMAFDRSCELEVPTSMACPRTTVERNEIPCELDMAVGPSLCGMALSLTCSCFSTPSELSVPSADCCRDCSYPR